MELRGRQRECDRCGIDGNTVHREGELLERVYGALVVGELAVAVRLIWPLAWLSPSCWSMLQRG